VIGSNFPLDDYDSVNTDFTQATELALSHLMGLGHQKIAFIGAEESQNMYGYRRYKTPTVNTYVDMMQHYQLFDEDYFIVKENSRLDVQTGEELTEQALALWQDRLPTAILAANDAFAIGVMESRFLKTSVLWASTIFRCPAMSLHPFLQSKHLLKRWVKRG